MKKILLSVVCLMMMGMQSVQAQVAIAALHHEGNVKIYAASGIQNAIDSSVKGDTIYLSEGIFPGFIIPRPIVIMGSGQTTAISGQVTLGKSNNTIFDVEEGLVLSGMNLMEGISFYGTIDRAIIKQCLISECTFHNTSSYAFKNIEIKMSKLNRVQLSSSVKSIVIMSSKINSILNNGSDEEGSVVVMNCNVNSPSTSTPSSKINNYVNCIIPRLGLGVYTNCLYNSNSSDAILYNCYQNSDFTLDDDLNCSMTDEQLKEAGYAGVDNTWVGINGGEVQYSLVMPVVQVTEHSVEVDQAERKLKVSLKLGNK